MKFYEFNKKKPQNNKILMIQVKDYGWGNSYSLKTEIAKMINGEYILSPTMLNIKIPLERIVRWCYV